MFNFIKTFRKDENGAVTVDWVVLTAAIVALAIVAFDTIGSNANALIGAAATDVSTFNPDDLAGGTTANQ